MGPVKVPLLRPKVGFVLSGGGSRGAYEAGIIHYLRTDLARRVPLAREVLGDQDVAGAEPAHGAVADLDVHRAREREDRVASRRVMPRIRARRLEAPDHDAAAGNELRGLRLVAA